MNIYQSSTPTFAASGFLTNQNRNNQPRNYNANSIRETAYGRWPKILESLGINPLYLKNKHGACPICREGKDRFRFDDQGRGTWFCNKCGAGDGFKLLQLCHDWRFPYTLDMVAKVLGVQDTDSSLSYPKHVNRYLNNIIRTYQSIDLREEEINKRCKFLTTTWQAATPITIGDPVDCYLKSRGLRLNIFPAALRYHSALPYYQDNTLVGYFPAMLAIVKNINNQSVTIHRTYLGNGCKADVSQPKKLMSPTTPRATQGAAIKLFEPVGSTLAVAEGIETALSYHSATHLPVWATISAGGMEKIKLPESVSNVVIAVDNDKSGRGQKAALTLSKRLLAEGRTVKRVMPPKVGYDFNDFLLEGNL